SVTDFVTSFDFKEDVKEIDLDLSNAHLWDDSAVGAIDKVVIKYHQNGIKVNIKGLNTESNKLVEKLAVYKMPGALDKVANE
ncbi:STAS domain-containing protein, partial [Paenibacillus phytohabitans]